MSVGRYEVRLLEDAVVFLRGLPVKFRAKAYRAIELLRDLGPQLPMPHSRALRNCDGLRELRVRLGRDIVRLFYFHHEGQVYVVTSGFVKKAQKTNPRELSRAMRLMAEFREG